MATKHTMLSMQMKFPTSLYIASYEIPLLACCNVETVPQSPIIHQNLQRIQYKTNILENSHGWVQLPPVCKVANTALRASQMVI